MGPESRESGLEELLRLSRQTSQVEQKLTQKPKPDSRKIQVVQGLKEIKLSVALEQLRTVANREIIAEVKSLSQKKSNADLRRLISDLADGLEREVGSLKGANQKLAAMERSVRTLVILIELLFSLE